MPAEEHAESSKRTPFDDDRASGRSCSYLWSAPPRRRRANGQFVPAAASPRVGDPAEDDAIEMGPVVSAAQQQRVLGFLDRATSNGTHVLLGGSTGRDTGFCIDIGRSVEACAPSRRRPATRLRAGERSGPDGLACVRWGRATRSRLSMNRPGKRLPAWWSATTASLAVVGAWVSTLMTVASRT